MPLFFKRDLPNPGRVEELKKVRARHHTESGASWWSERARARTHSRAPRARDVSPPARPLCLQEAQTVLSPDLFEGARFEFNKSLTQKFALAHSIMLSPGGAPGTYEFGANYADERLLLASRIDMQGRLNGRLNAQLGDRLLVRMQAQAGPEAPGQGNTFKADADYKGGCFSVGGYYISGGLLGCSYLQSLTSGLSVGGEGFYHASNSKARGGAGVMRLTWGEGSEEQVATAKVGSIGQGSVELSYHRKVSEKVGLATELQYYHNNFCTWGLGYDFKLRNASIKVRSYSN